MIVSFDVLLSNEDLTQSKKELPSASSFMVSLSMQHRKIPGKFMISFHILICNGFTFYNLGDFMVAI
jgi:hypothetical protein